MAEANLIIRVTKDDAALKELAAQLSAVFGGATAEKAKASAKALQDAVVSTAKESAKQQTQTAVTAQQAIQAATERRVKSEEQSEKLKFEQLKEEYKKNAKEIDDLNNAKKTATDKEAKAEIQIELQKAQELQKVYRKELSERPETKKGKASDVGMLGTKREVSETGGGLLKLAGVGAAIEGFKMLTEKTEDAAGAQKALQAGTGLSGKALEDAGKTAEELGGKFLVSANTAKTVMGKVAAYTGAQGEELKKQTEAAIAYSVATGKNMEMVGKLMATEQGRAKIMQDSAANVAKAQQAANNPAQKAAYIQQQLTEKIGDVALVVLNALGPALTAVIPIIDSLGSLVETVVKPAMDALQPVMTDIAKAFQDLAPVVVHLIEGAMKLVGPIIESLSGVIGDLIPVIIDAVKVVGEALSPVFDALVPVIKEVAGMFKDYLATFIRVELVPILNILVPIIRDVLAPVLLALMPLIQMVADLASTVLTPALKLVSGILQFIVTNAIQPLVKWLGGELTVAIKATVGIITEAIGAITKVVGAITSFLGLGGKAAAATKDVGKQVLDADKQNADALAQQKTIQEGQERIRERNELTAKLAHGKLTASEEAKLRSIAEDEQNDATIQKLDAFDAKKEAQASKAANKTKKDAKTAAKEAHDAELQQIEDAFSEKKAKLELQQLDEKADDKKAKLELLELEKQHAKDKLDVATKYGKDVTASTLAYRLADVAITKEKNAEIKELDDADIAEAQEQSKKLDAIAKTDLEISRSERDAEIADMKDGDQKLRVEAIEKGKRDIQDLNTALEQKELTREEYDRKVALAKQATEKELTKIDTDESGKRIENQKQEAAFFVGPFVTGFNKGISSIISSATKFTDKWAQSKNVLTATFGSILQGFTQMIEQMVEKIIANAAVFALANLFTGGAAGGITSILKGVIPGLAEGGIVNRPTVLRAGVMTQPTFLASGGLMPVIGGEAGPEAVIPLSSSRAQNQIGSAFGFDRALAPLHETLQSIAHSSAQTKVVQPMNNNFENNRNRFLYAQRLRKR